MTIYTVQCGFAEHYANTVQVRADTFDQALERAIAIANVDPNWRPIDYGGPTFIDAATIGADAHPWQDEQSVLPIPDRFTAAGEPPTVIVSIRDGQVCGVEVDGGRVRLLIKSYSSDRSYTLTAWPEDGGGA